MITIVHVPVSGFHGWNIDMLMEEIWNYLKVGLALNEE